MTLYTLLRVLQGLAYLRQCCIHMQQLQPDWQQHSSRHPHQPLMPRQMVASAATSSGGFGQDGTISHQQEGSSSQQAAGSSNGGSQHHHQQRQQKAVPMRITASTDEETYSLQDTKVRSLPSLSLGVAGKYA